MYVLAADSDPVMCKAIKFLLAGDGHEVATSCTGAGLVALAQEREPDLFVLDMGLPDIDCPKIYRYLRDAGSHSRVLFLVPRNESILQSDGLELIAGDFLVKPFEPDNLIARVRRISDGVEVASRKGPARRLSVGALQLYPDLSRVVINEDNVSRIVALSRSETEIAYLVLSSPAIMSLNALTGQLGLEPANEQARAAVDACVRSLRRKIESDPTNPEYFILAPHGAGTDASTGIAAAAGQTTTLRAR